LSKGLPIFVGEAHESLEKGLPFGPRHSWPPPGKAAACTDGGSLSTRSEIHEAIQISTRLRKRKAETIVDREEAGGKFF
jgi:hypothetical protein